MIYSKSRVSLSYQALKMFLFYVGQKTCSKVCLKILEMVLQKLRKHYNPNITQSLFPLVVYFFVMPAGLLIECLVKRPKKFKSKMFQVILYNSCWTVANGSLNPDPFFLNIVHLVEKGNLKLAELIFSSFENCNGVTCNKKQFLKSYKMAVSFKLNNFNFPSLSSSTVSKPVFSVPAASSFTCACRSSSYVSAFSHKSLSDPTNVFDDAVCSMFVQVNLLFQVTFL